MTKKDASASGVLADASPVKMAAFLSEIRRRAVEPDETWRHDLRVALDRLEGQHDLDWARLKVLEGGRLERVSGPPINAGRWLKLDTEAVGILRNIGDEDDFCSTLVVYEWHTLAECEAMIERSREWKKKSNVGRALSVAAETMMYRHGAFDRACEVLAMQLELHADGVASNDPDAIVEQAKSLVRMTMARLAAGELAKAVCTRDEAKAMVQRLGPDFIIYEHAGTKSGGDLYPGISMESNFAWYIEGDWQAVADHWVYAIGLEEPGGSPVHIVEAAMAAQAFARLDQYERATWMLGELTPILKLLNPRDWAVNGAVGRSSHAIWDMEAAEYAENYREFALELLAAGVGDWTNTSLEQTVARMSALLGDLSEAERYFEKARATLGVKASDPRRAIIDFDAAKATRLCRGDVGRRRELLSAAHGVFDELAMNGWSARIEREASFH